MPRTVTYWSAAAFVVATPTIVFFLLGQRGLEQAQLNCHKKGGILLRTYSQPHCLLPAPVSQAPTTVMTNTKRK